tara:strand:+ start:223 stop:399 length:177 start_codon:yes stop_codon:yes gene_type:complete
LKPTLKSLTALEVVDLTAGATALALVIVVDVILPSVLMNLPIILPLGLVIKNKKREPS